MSLLELEDEEEELYIHHELTVDPGQVLMRIDKYLPIHSKNVTRSKVQTSIDAGSIKVNGQNVKASYKVKPGDHILLALPYEKVDFDLIAQNIPLDIIYEDEELLIINKEPGIVVHPALGHPNGTLINALMYHFSNLPTHKHGELRPGLVHRIDKDTSGLLLIAKTEFSMAFLAKQFADHSIERTYFALAWGHFKENAGTVKTNLIRDPRDRKRYTTAPLDGAGKYAVTHYEVLEQFSNTSLIKCKLETGRTHQIRVHMKSLGHTLFADKEYGGTSIAKGIITQKYKQFVENCFQLCGRQALHAGTLGFVHPNGKWMQFECPLPVDMAALVDKWRAYSPKIDM